MTTSLIIGSDHAGFDYKQQLIAFLESKNIAVTDAGTHSEASVDYPDFAHIVAKAVENKEFESGILLCGSGNGVAITANHHAGIRAGLAWNTEVARLVRQHNNANVLCLPARFITIEEAKQCIEVFLETPFEGGRHERRVAKITMC